LSEPVWRSDPLGCLLGALDPAVFFADYYERRSLRS
jgi:hypothetical protein